MKLLISNLILILACSSQNSERMQDEKFTFLALGDSYTIGESVEDEGRWPVQLVQQLKNDGIDISDPKIIATTGWTTGELISAIEKENLQYTYSIVSLLIGVNNQYRGNSISQYEREFEQLLIQAIKFTGDKSENVFVVSIPDYGVTPFAQEKGLDATKITTELDQYNLIAEQICKKANVSFINITPSSRSAKNDNSLIAPDGLHPSARMYKQWIDQIYSKVYDNLSSR